MEALERDDHLPVKRTASDDASPAVQHFQVSKMQTNTFLLFQKISHLGNSVMAAQDERDNFWTMMSSVWFWMVSINTALFHSLITRGSAVAPRNFQVTVCLSSIVCKAFLYSSTLILTKACKMGVIIICFTDRKECCRELSELVKVAQLRNGRAKAQRRVPNTKYCLLFH